MLAKRIIPCLDVKDGRVVKGVNFVGLRDAGDPVEIAARYDAEQADELTFLDITASHEARRTMIDVVERTADRVFMPLTVGGGVREVADVRALLNAGADKVSINTAAIERPAVVAEAAERFGSQCVVVAIDARRVPGAPAEAPRFEVFTHGGRRATGLDAVAWAERMERAGAGEILLTSMDRDGTQIGYDLELDERREPPRADPGRRVGRRRHARAPLRGARDRRRQRGPRRLDLPLRHVYRPRMQGLPAGARRGGSNLTVAGVDRARLLRLMDLNMWEMVREFTRTGRNTEVLETSALTMVAHPEGAFFNNVALVRTAVDADTVTAALGGFYLERGLSFALALRGHADRELEAALLARGFTVPVHEPGMVLLADPGTRCDPPGLEVRAATTDRDRRDFLHVSAEAYATYDQSRAYTADVFATLESVCAPQVQGYVGYVDGEPAAAAALYASHGVAGVGWVGTVPRHRGKGYAEAVTWAVVREGFRRGAAFVNLQASPMGGPVYARMGFTTPTSYHLLVPRE